MAKTFRVIQSDIYREHLFENCLSIPERYFKLYLLTNPQANQLGIYSLSKGLLSYDMQSTVEEVEALLDKFEHEYNLIRYDHETSEIAVLHSLAGSIVSGGKPVEDLLVKELTQVKSTYLIQEVYTSMTNFWINSERPFDKKVQACVNHELTKRAQNQHNESLLRFVSNNDNENEDANDNVNDNVMTMTSATNKDTSAERITQATLPTDDLMTSTLERNHQASPDTFPQAEQAHENMPYELGSAQALAPNPQNKVVSLPSPQTEVLSTETPQADSTSLPTLDELSDNTVTFGQFASKLTQEQIATALDQLDIHQGLHLMYLKHTFSTKLSQRECLELIYALEYFDFDLVEEASKRAQKATHPYPYTLKILQKWYDAGVKTMEEVQKLDTQHRKQYQNAQQTIHIEVLPEWMQALQASKQKEASL